MSKANYDRVAQIWYDNGPAIPPKIVNGKIFPQCEKLFRALEAELDRKDRKVTSLNDIINRAREVLND